ncbi:taste receptor type 2 member 1 [Macrotis lagotis]|uniref:taste receptor type 2 member 1 n=1 Tax=Macrotis lagotis TaxID=92651 RepID=UPI003D68DEF0
MTELLLIIQLIFGLVQFLVGIMANAIIVIVNGLECIKRKSIISYNFLLTCLGIFRIFLLMLIFATQVVFFFALELYVDHRSFIFFFFINEVNLWLTTYLCVFYCIKIANIVCPIFVWLKMRLSRLVPWWILGSLLFSSAISICHNSMYWSKAREELRRILVGNATTQFLFQYMFPVPILVVGLAIPLCVFNAASFLLIYSLCRHIRQIKNTATGFRDPRTAAHIRALKSVFSFLILYISYHVGVILYASYSSKRDFWWFFCFSITLLYPSGHSIILILGDSKLKHYTRKFLPSAKCFLRGGSALDSTQTK